MKAIILAAGKATRLLPLTKDTPQSLLKVGSKTIIEKQIETLKKAGVTNIIVITGYLAENLESYCQKLKTKTIFNPFYAVSGMALTLWVAKQELEEDIIILYSDILFEPQIVQSLTHTKVDICIAIKKDGLRVEAEKVVEKAGKIVSLSKASTSKENGEFIGMAKFTKNSGKILTTLLEKAARANLNSSLMQILNQLIEQGETIHACDIKDTKFIDIDFPDDLKKAEKLF